MKLLRCIGCGRDFRVPVLEDEAFFGRLCNGRYIHSLFGLHGQHLGRLSVFRVKGECHIPDTISLCLGCFLRPLRVQVQVLFSSGSFFQVPAVKDISCLSRVLFRQPDPVSGFDGFLREHLARCLVEDNVILSIVLVRLQVQSVCIQRQVQVLQGQLCAVLFVLVKPGLRQTGFIAFVRLVFHHECLQIFKGQVRPALFGIFLFHRLVCQFSRGFCSAVRIDVCHLKGMFLCIASRFFFCEYSRRAHDRQHAGCGCGSFQNSVHQFCPLFLYHSR